MGFKFNPFIGNFDFDSAASATSWLQPVASEATLPLVGNTDGDARVSIDTDYIWVWDIATSRWINSGIKSATIGSTPNASGYSLSLVNVGANRTERQLVLQPADTANPGIITTGSQSISGDKTFNNNVVIVGDLTVQGTTTSINSTNLEVEDQNIFINKNGNDASSEGAGLTVDRTGSHGSLVFANALASKWKAGFVGSEIELANVSSIQTFTNKLIDADLNTITNIDDNEIKAGAGINATKIGLGSVDNTEFSYLDGASSNIQSQLDSLSSSVTNKADRNLNNLTSPTSINQHLLFDTNATRDIGSNSNYSRTIFVHGTVSGGTGGVNVMSSPTNTNIILGGGVTTPSGNANTWGVFGDAAGTSNMFFGSRNQSVSTGRLYLETGNMTGSTAAQVSGLISVSTGAHTNAANTSATGGVTIATGNNSGTGPGANTGSLLLQTGTVVGGTRGDISLNSRAITLVTTNGIAATGNVSPSAHVTYNLGAPTGAWNILYTRFVLGRAADFTVGSDFNTGFQANFQSGHSNTANPTGPITIHSGDQIAVGSGTVGAATFRGGDILEPTNANNTALVTLRSGNTSGVGNTGDILIQVGTVTSGTRGNIRLVDASLAGAAAGYVWTLTNATTGAGAWQPGGGGAGANTTLSNLVNTIAIPDTVDLLPANTNQVSLGSSTKRFDQAFVRAYQAVDATQGTVGRLAATNLSTTPAGTSYTLGLISDYLGATAANLAIFSSSNGSADANKTRDVLIETGNKTAGTGGSGDVRVQTGTSAGGTRGSIFLNAQQIEMGVPFGGTVFINSNQVTLRAASSGALRLGSSSIQVGEFHGRNTSTATSGGPVRIYGRVTSANQLLGLHSDITSPTGLTRGGNIINPHQETDQSGQGNIIIFTEQNTASSAAQVGGAIFLETGNRVTATANASSGGFRAQTGTNPTGFSGGLSLISGAANNTGDINLTSGNGTINSGNINITAGTAGTLRGQLSINARQVDINNTKIVNVTDPTAAQDAATKNYVDNTVSTSIAAIAAPTWYKYTVSEAAFTAAATAEDIELFQLPAKGVIHSVIMKHTASFTGGSITTFTLGVGVSGNLSKYASAFDVLQATGSNVSQASNSLDVEDFTSPTSIRLSANTVGGNVADATSGSVDVYVLWGVLP